MRQHDCEVGGAPRQAAAAALGQGGDRRPGIADRVGESPRQLAQRRAIDALAGARELARPTASRAAAALQRNAAPDSGSESPVAQCVKWPAWLSWGSDSDPESDADSDSGPTFVSAEDQRLNAIFMAAHEDEQHQRAIARRGGLSQPVGDGQNHAILDSMLRSEDDARETPLGQRVGDYVGKAGSVGGFVGGQLTYLSEMADAQGLGSVGRWTKTSSAGLGVVGALSDAAYGAYDIATSESGAADKAVTGGNVLGSLAKSAQIGATGALPFLEAGSGLGGLVSHAIGPVAVAAGGADVLTGLAAGGLAHARSNALARDPQEMPGISRYASDAQWLMAKNNYIKAAGGAVSMLGGAALLAAGVSNPLGWGLLAGGSVIGSGLAAAHKLYGNYQLSNALKEDDYKSSLADDRVDVDDSPDRRGLLDWLKPDWMRRNDDVRGQIATKLAEKEGGIYGTRATGIVSALGVKELPPPSEDAPLQAPERDRRGRAKAIAKALGA